MVVSLHHIKTNPPYNIFFLITTKPTPTCPEMQHIFMVNRKKLLSMVNLSSSCPQAFVAERGSDRCSG